MTVDDLFTCAICGEGPFLFARSLFDHEDEEHADLIVYEHITYSRPRDDVR